MTTNQFLIFLLLLLLIVFLILLLILLFLSRTPRLTSVQFFFASFVSFVVS
jgi:hypothetical protein